MAADEGVRPTPDPPLRAQICHLETELAVKCCRISGYEARLYDPTLSDLDRVETEGYITRARLDLDRIDRHLAPLRTASLAAEISSYPGALPPGSLLVDCGSGRGEDRRRFEDTPIGSAVSAAGTVRSIHLLAGGYARGVLVGEGGYVVFYVDANVLPRLSDALHGEVRVKIQGTHQLVGMLPVLDVSAA